jgi:hypothetical protein
VLHVIALVGAVYGFARAIMDLLGWLRRVRLKFYMSDDVWPVADRNRLQFAMNIQIVAYNPGRKMAALRRLEATLIRPAFTDGFPQKAFTLVWRLFIKEGPSAGFGESEPVFVKAVTPKDSVVLSVQLRGDYDDEADSLHQGHFNWFPGRYTFHLYGLINRRRVRISPRSGFTFDVSSPVSVQLDAAEGSSPFTRRVQLDQQ